jgi:ferritin-like metal-binding protein YciE
LRAQKLQSEAIRGLIADAEWGMKNVKGAIALDAAIIAAFQCIEHYEMAMYDSAILWGKLLDHVDMVDWLQETFDEEAETSDELTEIAVSITGESDVLKDQDDEDGDDEDDEDDESEEE